MFYSYIKNIYRRITAAGASTRGKDIVNIPASLAERTRRVVDGREGHDSPIDQDARSDGALALCGNCSVILALRPDGTLWEIDPDSVAPLVPLGKDMQTTALVAGTERYPWLKELLPKQPSTAIDCTLCNGAGKLGSDKVKNLTGEMFCDRCDGLGWIKRK